MISRPFPQAIAGDIQSFFFNHATRTLDIEIKTDNSKGASKVFIGANRHYPDGFSILIDSDIVMFYNPLKNVGLETYKSPNGFDPSNYIWDSNTQKLIILTWPTDQAFLNIKIVPGLRNFD